MNLLISAISFIVLYTGCMNNPGKKHLRGFEKFARTDVTMILSCVRCGCVIDELNNFSNQQKIDTSKVQILGDTACIAGLHKEIPVTFLSQKSIDSVSTDFYNLIVILRRKNGYEIQEIATENVERIRKYLTR